MFNVDVLRVARKAMYSDENIQEFAAQVAAGIYDYIPMNLAEYIKDRYPETKDELTLWVYTCLERTGLVGRFSPKANPLQPNNKSHMDFIADAFFEQTQDCIVLGNRKGAKTLAFATLLFLESKFKPGIELAHLGAIKDQAYRCYRYFTKMAKHPYFVDNLIKAPGTTRTTFKNSSVVEILVGTISGTNSPHPVKAQIDEVELMDWNVLQEALNMASSMGNYAGATRLTSTRKYSTGTMQQMLDTAEERGFTRYEWNIWDTVEACQLAKSPATEVIADAGGSLHKVSRECMSCPLCIRCHGLAKTSYGGVIPLADAIRSVKNLDSEVWESQVECQRPGTTDLIFPMFTERTHVINYAEYLQAHGVVNRDDGSLLSFNPNLPVYAGQDAGFECPATVFGQVLDDDTFVIFSEVDIRNIAPSVFVADSLIPRDEEYIVDTWYCDPSGLQLISEMELRGLNTQLAENSVDTGIDLLRSMFATGRLLIDESCTALIKQLKTYKKTKTGKVRPNQDDHHVDATRYLLMSIGLFESTLETVYTGQ